MYLQRASLSACPLCACNNLPLAAHLHRSLATQEARAALHSSAGFSAYKSSSR